MLNDGSPREKVIAADAMGLFESAVVKESLMRALTNNAGAVRARALYTLSHPMYPKDEAFLTTVLPI